MNENFDEFNKYVMDFDFNEDMIAYKYNHSYRVLHQCDEISYTLNLDEEDNYLTCLIGLLHVILFVFLYMYIHKNYLSTKAADAKNATIDKMYIDKEDDDKLSLNSRLRSLSP